MLGIRFVKMYKRWIVEQKSRIIVGIILPLLLGMMIYIILSPNSYITTSFWRVFRIDNPFGMLKVSNMHWSIKLVRFYLCDFLWALALFQSMFLILQDENTLIVFILVLLFCIAFELFQKASVISGSFDYMDIAVEGVAGLLSFLFENKYGRTKHEKID